MKPRLLLFLRDAAKTLLLRMSEGHHDREHRISSDVIPGWPERPDPESRDSGFASLTRTAMTTNILDRKT
jgi:hypothetical protein